ncbi:MAG: hypothetical protein JWN30_1206 [Bacilli bacterium]|nr:hypothetical protein [Bacilli bacterium]
MSLSKQMLDSLESRLVEEREHLLKRLSDNDKYGLDSTMRETLGELSVVDNHPADIGDEVFERGKDLALRDQDSLRLHKIDHALDRISQGTYGTCEHCGTEIAFARLDAEPAADLCVICQEKKEDIEINTNRPVEENFLFPGYGRSDLDTTRDMEYTGYDGEDAWQEVARYGTSSSYSDVQAGYVSDPDELYIESEERIGYVEDMEGFLTADIYGNATGYTRNAAYYRKLGEPEFLEPNGDIQ